MESSPFWKPGDPNTNPDDWGIRDALSYHSMLNAKPETYTIAVAADPQIRRYLTPCFDDKHAMQAGASFWDFSPVGNQVMTPTSSHRLVRYENDSMVNIYSLVEFATFVEEDLIFPERADLILWLGVKGFQTPSALLAQLTYRLRDRNLEPHLRYIT